MALKTNRVPLEDIFQETRPSLEETFDVPKQPKSRFQSFAGGVGGALQGLASVTTDPLGRAAIRPPLSLIRGLQGSQAPLQTPFGEVKPFSTTGAGEALGEAVTVATSGLPVESLLKTPLTKAAQAIYQSGAKFKDVVKGGKVIQKGKELAKIGLKERVWLTEGGVEKVASKIDEFEGILGDAIEQAKGKTISFSRQALQSYLNEARDLFRNQFDQKAAGKALDEINRIQKDFLKRFGGEIPLETAQKIKTSTGTILRKAYGEMSGAAQEAQKQGVRFLKEKIVEAAPEIGQINNRLRSLYQLDQALAKSTGRVSRLNLLGLPSKVGGAVAGVPGVVAGKLLELLDAPAIKSGLAIGLDKLAGVSGKVGAAVKVPLVNVIRNIIKELKE